MITEFGFSDVLGPLRYTDNEQEVFLGHSVTQRKNVSDSTAEKIDSEIRRLIEEAERTARRILTERRADLDALAKALLEYESLSGEEIEAVLRGEPVHRSAPEEPAAGTERKSSVPTSGKKKPFRKKGGDAGNLNPEPQPGT